MLHANLSAGLAKSQTPSRSTVQGPVHVPHASAGGIKSCRLLGRPAAASQRQLAVVRPPRLRTTNVAATASTAVEDPASSTANIPKLEREVAEKKSNKEAILFQGMFPCTDVRRQRRTKHLHHLHIGRGQAAQWAGKSTRATQSHCGLTFMSAGFGWDSCSKGNWYKHLISKVPDLVVSVLKLLTFCRK